MTQLLRILIVDDQPRARKSVRALLSTWPRVGEIGEAGDGCEALRLVEDLQPDVVLMDVRMPALDGLEATRRIKALRPQAKVVVLSMYGQHRDQALAARADAFVGKDEATGALLDVLVRVMEGRDVSGDQ